MADISVKDYKIYNLQGEYNKFSNYLLDFQNHIERSYNNNMITINDRNNYFKILNDLLRQTNTIYNTNMMDICGTDLSESEDDQDERKKNNMLSEIFPLANLTNINSANMFDEIKNLVNLCKILNLESVSGKNDEIYANIFKEPFIDIKNNLLNKIGSKIGFLSLDSGLSLIMGDQYDKLYDKNVVNPFELYNKIFIPTKYSMRTLNKNEKRHLFFKKVNINNDVLLDNCAELYFKKINDDYNKYIVFSGYFQYDSLNITLRTSQICNNFIYQKKKAIELYISDSDIDSKFIRSYLRNSPLSDFIILAKDEYLDQIQKDYKMFNKLTKLSFMNIMKEFVKEDKDHKLSIKYMYTIIKLLLLGSDENINIAGLLYGISKERKPGSECSISDIIYRNLSYISQIKLRKTSLNIKNELDKIKAMTTDDIDLKKQIAVCKNMPNAVKKSALEKIEEMKSSNNEYYKQLLYVKTLLNYPWPSSNDDIMFVNIGKNDDKSKEFLDGAIEKLDDVVYGHKECKDSIKELIGKWISNPSSSGSSIGLKGPPGVGKTLIARAIGGALGIPFVQITLGGQNDGELLHGHGYTYSGAQPGMVVKKMVEAGNARCVMYFDELDKACKKHDSNEIFNILIHMIDPNTNAEFQDRFFQEMNFPLNKVLFVFSYNDSSLIDNILMDRIKEIDVKPFKLDDKKHIVQQFVINEMCEQVNFEKDSVIINNEDVEFIIDQYTYEPGVRDLKRKIEKLFLKLNIDKIYKENIFKELGKPTKKNPLVLTKEIIQDYLGKHSMDIQCVHEEDQVGVINGLYATDAGYGGILPIQVYNNYTGGDDKFALKLTGNQRKIMRESVISAFTTAINIVNEDIRKEYFLSHKGGLHIHCPNSAATPKNGPSGGVGFATAFVSKILGKRIRHDIAMTGEIELTGKITKIGGLQYKLTGAKKAGVKLVLVSKENKEDVETIKK